MTQQYSKLREQILERDNHTCQTCNSEFKKLEVHHIIPKRKQGLDSVNNLVTVCLECHDMIELFRQSSKNKWVNIKLITLREETYKRLDSIGEKGDTYNDLVKKLLDYYQNGKKKK